MYKKRIKSALLSVYYKDGLEPIVRELDRLKVIIFDGRHSGVYREPRHQSRGGGRPHNLPVYPRRTRENLAPKDIRWHFGAA